MIPKLIRKREANYNGRNITRLYYIVNPKANGEARVDVWAVKNDPQKRLVAKKVVKYYTDKNRYMVRYVMRSNFTNSLCINWAEQPWGHKHQAVWSDVDEECKEWGICDYHFKNDWSQVFLRGEWLNGWEGTRYIKCGDEYAYWYHFKQYLECWNISHATEFLAKSGLLQFISPSFIKRLRDDKDFFRYFRSSIQQIKQGRYGKGAVNRAYRTGETLAEASTYLTNMAILIPVSKRIPKCVDRKRLFKWLDGDVNKLYAYAEYCDNLSICHADITAHGMMFPTTRTMDIINEQAHHDELMAERRRIAKEVRKLKRIRKAIERMDKHCYLNDLAIIFPTKQEEYIAEGNYMENCIGAIYRADDKKNIIGFIRKGDKPYADFRIDTTTLKRMEVRYRGNVDASEELGALVDDLANNIKKNIKQRKVA